MADAECVFKLGIRNMKKKILVQENKIRFSIYSCACAAAEQIFYRKVLDLGF